MPTSAHADCTAFAEIYGKFVTSQWADVDIGPYNAYRYSVRDFELLQVSRERFKKTEAVFLVGSRRSGGKSKSLRARFLFPIFSFGEAKEKTEGQSLISNMSPYIANYIVDHKGLCCGHSIRARSSSV